MSIKKRMKGLAMLLMAATVLSAQSVSAANEPVGMNGIKITGQTTCGKKDCMAGLSLWSPGKSIADLHQETDKRKFTESIVYSNQTMTSDDGFYEFVFELENEKSGIYKAHISCECTDSFITEDVLYSNPEENKLALLLLNSAANEEDSVSALTGIINEYGIALGFDNYENVDSLTAQLLVAYIKETPFSETDKIKAINVYQKAVAATEIKKGEAENIAERKDVLKLDESKLKDLYKQNYVDANFLKSWTALVKEMKWNTLSEFDSAVEEAFVLTTVRYPNGYANIIKVVDVFYEDIGLSGSINQTVAIKISNKSYESYEKLRDAINNGGTSDSKPSGGGGGGGGGGSSSGGSSVVSGSDLSYSKEYITESEPNKLSENIFSDIDGVEWAKEAIVTLADEKIINGKGNNKFCPDDFITREEFVKLIVAAFIPNGKKADVAFLDVPSDVWYTDYVKVAYEKGVVKGISDTMFGSGSNITRQDMAVIARRVIDACGLKTEINQEKEAFVFSDDAGIADYAKTGVYDLYKMGLVNGVSESEFSPGTLVTRAQAAKIIYNLYMLKQ